MQIQELPELIDIATYILLGGAIGFLIGLTGVGGGVLTVPVLIIAVRLNPIAAVGTASFYAVLTKVYAVYRHQLQRTVNWKVGIRFFGIALPGLLLSALLVNCAKAGLSLSGVERLQDAVSYLIIFSILFSLIALLFDYRKVENKLAATTLGKALAVVGIFLVGAIMGATSIGGGVLIIPALLIVFRETSKYVGTSLLISVMLMAVMSAIYAFVGHNGHLGEVNAEVAAYMALGSLAGTHWGSSLSKRINPKRLQFIVIGIILLSVVLMVLDKAV